MINSRLCFILLYCDKKFNLSRNFTLQNVGDTEWVIGNYEFNEMSKSIDELVILNISNPLFSNKYFNDLRV